MSKLRICGSASLAVLLLVAAPALAGKPVLISECGAKIYDPGKYFVTQDLYCDAGQQGIKVFSSDVTVNLKGHTITCDQGAGLVGAVLVGGTDDDDGVYDGLTNVRVKNGTVSGCDDAVIFFFTESGEISKITATNNDSPVGAGGITLLEASNTVVKHNVGVDNYNAIRSFAGFNNEFKHNWSTGSTDTGLYVEGGTGSRLLCNTSEWDANGIGLGPDSSGNIVRGNFINNAGYSGIGLFTFFFDGSLYGGFPHDNVVTNNLVQGSPRADLVEAVFDFGIFDFAVLEDAQCQNRWKNNQYSTWISPENCIAPTVVLDDDDVCALDDDDDSDSD